MKKNYTSRVNWIWVLLISLFLFSCDKNSTLVSEPFYSYDFEQDYTNVDSAFVSSFDGSKVIGPFNNDGFSIHFEDVPNHQFIRIQFDLFLHDSWEGNTNNTRADTPDHDAWLLELDPHLKLNAGDRYIFETTFSNGLCVPGWCFSQSYPNEFPFHNEARTGQKRSTWGRCLWQDTPGGTSIYRIDQIFPHERNEFVFLLYDKLKQDAPFNALCEESWSVDNLEISLLVEQ